MVTEIKIRQSTFLAFFGLILAVFIAGVLILSVNSSNGLIQNPSGTGIIQNGQIQEVYVKALRTGDYNPMQITVRKGIPVRLHFSTEGNVGCGSLLVVYGLNVRVSSQNNTENIVEFTPPQEGTFEYSCGMHMFGPGHLTVMP